MRFDNIIIEDKIKEKILSKHNVEAREIINVLLGRHLILKTKMERYIAIGYYQRYLTLIFEKKWKNTNIVTAYHRQRLKLSFIKEKMVKELYEDLSEEELGEFGEVKDISLMKMGIY